MATDDDRSIDRRTAAGGGVAGAAAYLLGYVLTYAWRAPYVEDSLRLINAAAEVLGGAGAPTWKAVGWLFYGAHAVSTRVPAPGGTRLVNFVAEADDGSVVLLYALPPLLLVLAGAALVRLDGADRLATAAARGATVVVGYLPLAAVGAVAVAHAFGGDVRVAPDLLAAVAVAGVVYPAFFGALGGMIGHRAGRWVRA